MDGQNRDVFFECPKNSLETVRINAYADKGNVYVGLRVWTTRTGTPQPCKGKGFAIKPASLPKLILALQKMQAHLDGENSRILQATGEPDGESSGILPADEPTEEH